MYSVDKKLISSVLFLTLSLVACNSNGDGAPSSDSNEWVEIPNDPSGDPTPDPECLNLPVDSLLNGSFEQLDNSVGNNNNLAQNQIVDLHAWDIFSSVAGWTSVDGGGIELWGENYNGVQPSDGNVLMEIEGNYPNTISQNFCATAGRKKISLDVYARTGILGDNIVDVIIDSTNVLHIDPTHRFFKTYTTDFVLKAGKHTLQFSSEAGINPGMGGLIDNVKLTNMNL